VPAPPRRRLFDLAWRRLSARAHMAEDVSR